jgi:hypothetical protein
MLIRSGRGMSTLNAGTQSPDDIIGMTSFITVNDLSNATYSSGSGGDGSIFATLGDVSGNSNDYTLDGSSVDDFEYAVSGSRGLPVMRKTGSKVCFTSDSASLYGAAATIIFFFTLPSSRSTSGGAIGSLLTSSGIFNMDSGDTPTYRVDETSSPVSISAVDENGLVMMGVSFSSDSSAVLWSNNTNTTFDPFDSYTYNGNVRVGSQSPTTAGPEAEYYAILSYNRALTNAEMQSVYQWGVSEFG